MNIELTAEKVETILTSLGYSKQRVRDAQGTPYEVRQETLAKLDSAIDSLRAARKN